MTINKSTPKNFVATVYGDLVPLNNSALSKARLKIFYKGMNRNGSYITDEIAEKMLGTLPGTPIVGYFDGDKNDFLGHVEKEANRAYGFVPENMNFKWEMSLDPDGVYRTYACTDVVLWTGRYPVASKIVGKSHSMELNPDTIQGEWVERDDEFCFEFTNAEFIGLCVLGEDYEPCFEGSSFYELHKEDKLGSVSADLKEMYSLYSQIASSADENPTGGQEMEEEKKDALESTITPEEETEKEVPTENELEAEVETEEVPAEEEKEEEEGAASEEQSEEESEEEEEEGSEEPEEESDEESDEEEGEEEDKESEDEESEEEESEEQPEVDLNAELAKKDEEIASLKEELESLKSYKAQKIQEEKENVLNSYSNRLTEEEVNDFKAKLESYESAADLKKDIALSILDKEVEVEEEDDKSQYSLVNSQKSKLTGAASIVAQYVNK